MLHSILHHHWLHPDVVQLWSDRSLVEHLIRVEVALASAQAELNLIPAEAARAVAARADAATLDYERLRTGIATTMHPFVPLLHQLEAQCGEDAAGYLHWGATTQNIFDTAAALQLKSTHELLVSRIDRAIAELRTLARRHARALQAGRTHGQHALPITFGFKVVAWLAEIERHRERLEQARPGACVANIGGAVGTLASMGGAGREVQRRVAQRLGLEAATVPVRSSADGVAAYANAVVILGATIEKIAAEVVFLQRTEIGELSERDGGGRVGSSTMAQKRNPQLAQNLVAMSCLLRARAPLLVQGMLIGNEGDSSASSVLSFTLPEVAILGVSLADGLGTLLSGLRVDETAMARNLQITKGLIVTEAVMMALGRKIGRHRAHQLLHEVTGECVASGRTIEYALRDNAQVRAVLSAEQLSALLRPENYLGEIAELIDAVLAGGPARGRGAST